MSQPPTCYLNGEFVALASARISVLDRGFIFGDGVYEVMPVADGRLVGGIEHLERLERSLAAIAIANPHPHDEWLRIIGRVVADNGGGSQSVYLQITRGVAERDHAYPIAVAPTVFVMSKPLAAGTALARVTARVMADNRWGRCDIKSTSLLGNVLLRNAALAAGDYEAILVRDGLVTEGSASNVFIVGEGRVSTPPLSDRILAGVTRALLIETLDLAGIPVSETPITERELRAADEIWLTSSTRDLLLVTALDGEPRTQRQDTVLAERAFALFQERKRR